MLTSRVMTACWAIPQAVELDGRDGHSWLLLARTYERVGNVAAARDTFERVSDRLTARGRTRRAAILVDVFASRREMAEACSC